MSRIAVILAALANVGDALALDDLNESKHPSVPKEATQEECWDSDPLPAFEQPSRMPDLPMK